MPGSSTYTEVRRRAVVAVHLPGGAPRIDPTRLVLNTAAGGRSFECRMHRSGVFYFLDVPAGRYTLDQTDGRGKVVRTEKVVVEAYSDQARMPVVSLALDAAKPGRDT